MKTNDYLGTSKIIPLSQIKNEENFKFIGIDKNGNEHFCIVRVEDGIFYMDSNTIVFSSLIGWIPDATYKSN